MKRISEALCTCAFAKSKSGYYIRHVCLSVRMKKLASHKEAILWKLIFEYFWKMCREKPNFFKIAQEQRQFA
jgi:hypothetical protein